MTEMLRDGAADAPVHLVLAHGAGAAMTSPFLQRIAAMLGVRGLCVHRFEFPYMAARRGGGTKRPPPKAETLADDYKAAVAQISAQLKPGQNLFIGGKSMGGRVASLVADELHASGRIAGLVCLGYPFHPIGKPQVLRTAHLAKLKCPALIVQGTRDLFGNRAEVEGYELAGPIRLHWIEGGDHDLKGGGRGVTDDVADVIAEYCGQRRL